MRKRLLIVCLTAVFVSSVLSGAIWDKPEVALDTEKYTMYQNMTAAGLITAFTGDFDSASARFDDGRLSVLGRVSEVGTKGKSLMLAAGSGTVSGTIECTVSDSKVRDKVLTLKQGDTVRVMGKVSATSLFARKSYSFEVDAIDSEPSMLTAGSVYFFADGSFIDSRNMTQQTISGRKVRYSIPAEWKAVEHNITDEGLGSIDGFQYRLNEIPDSAAVEPESLFVCYFDNNRLTNSSDRKETKLIEEEIVKNILDLSVITKFPLRSDTTYYGAKYQYYQNSYRDSLGQGYHAEFVFQPVENDGIVVFLYVYKDSPHRNQIMSVMRFLTVE